MIRSDARLTYGQAQRRDVPPEVADELELAAAYSAELRRRRFARGALRVERPEIAFEFDGEGGVAGDLARASRSRTRSIEELMILANEAVAGLLAGRRREALYRVHERPDPQAIELAAREARRPRRADAARPGRPHAGDGRARRRRDQRARHRVRRAAPAAAARPFRRSSSAR